MIIRSRIRIKETIANLICRKAIQENVINEINNRRKELEDYINNDITFLYSLEPVDLKDNMPNIVKEMCIATRKAGVGPMASVAGAISHYAVKKIIDCKEEFGIFDNGGDIALITNHELVIGIYTGNAKIQNIGLRIKPCKNILGICTSSGVIGHSLSFGKAHSVTVLSNDTMLSDAVATALCNECKIKDPVLIEEALNKYYIEGIIGAIVIYDDYLGMIGELPEICESKIDFELIAK